MSWRTVVIANVAKLDYQIGYLVVRGQETTRIHLNEIKTLIIESTAVSMTAYLLSELTKNKVKVIFCDEKRNPSSELLPCYGSHDTSLKLRNQIKWDEIRKKEVWTQIVKEKILQQAALLQSLSKEEYRMLVSYAEEMEFGDETNREGHAAKVYFNAMFGKQFTRTEECPLNAALNYGYSILLSMFNREIVSNGYLTQLGLFHENMFNPFNLASDLMEPFRPIVDELVWKMKPECFETEEKRDILQMVNREVSIAGRREMLDNAVKIYCKSIFDVLEGNADAVIRFYEK
jgi:CRISPR-associated endonuclease cas1, NMENI subtype